MNTKINQIPKTSRLREIFTRKNKAENKTDSAIQISKDVLVKDMQLVFQGGQQSSQDAKEEKAALLLQSLRGSDKTSFSNGIAGGLNATASLRNYYDVLNKAKTLLEDFPEGRSGIFHFINHRLGLPEDLRPIAQSSVNPTYDGNSGPLGNVRDFENDSSYQGIWSAWNRADSRVHKITDQTIDKLFGLWRFSPQLQPSTLNYSNKGEFKAGIISLYARAAERGFPVKTSMPSLLKSAPAVPEVASALLRFARATGQDEHELVFPNGEQVATIAGVATLGKKTSDPETQAARRTAGR